MTEPSMSKPKAKKFKKAKVVDENSGGSKNYQKPLTGGKGKKRPSEGNAEDSWELAVKKARGTPDGESDVSALSAKTTSNILGEAKKKSVKTIKSAGDKIKKFKSKSSPEDKKDGEKETQEDNEKTKLENMTVKQRKEYRKMRKNNYDTFKRAKAIWEQLRVKSLEKEKKKVLSEQLFQLVQGKAKEMIFAHDMSRVVQCLMKYGNQNHRSKLFEELRDCIVEIMKSKYAKFFVKKLLKYGTKAQRDYVFRSLYGKVGKLVRHKEAAEVVEYAYNDFANSSQRALMIEEFYGPTYLLYKTPELQTVEQIVASSNDKREKILSHMKEALSVLVDKTVCQFTIVHKVFYEFFSLATEKFKVDMIDVVRESLIHMLHTSEGAQVTMQCLWNGSTKSRKVIVKSMKSYVVKICKEEYGHLALLALFDVVDDTKLTQKAIIDEILKDLKDVVKDQYGVKVLLYLLSKRDPLHFNAEIIRMLQAGDDNPHSKKDPARRKDELCEYVSAPLLQHMMDNCRDLATTGSSLLLMVSILTHAKGDPTDAMKAMCELAAEPFSSKNAGDFHIIEHPAGHMTLKKLIQSDHDRIKRSEEILFTKVLLDNLPDGSLKSWAACNRGCFILIIMLELGLDEVSKKVKSELLPIKKSLSKLNFKGAQVLLEKLEK